MLTSLNIKLYFEHNRQVEQYVQPDKTDFAKLITRIQSIPNSNISLHTNE